MSQKWNLQDIKPGDAAPRRNTRPIEAKPRFTTPVDEPTEEKQTPRYQAPRRKTGGGNGKRSIVAFIVVAVIVALAVILGLLLGGAELVVHPKYKDVTVSGTFVAKTEPLAGELGYEILTLEADAERQVEATGKEEVEERAEGTVTIYNNHSTSPVRLVKNTRFASADGKIFRIEESAVVPGYTGEGSAQTPGTVTAKVFADEAGEAYNVPAGRFTIPGFEGEPEFDNVYAESQAAFTGGFSGEKYIVDESGLESTKEALHEEIRSALRARLETERPAGFVLYEDAVTFRFTSLPATEAPEGKAVIKERGTLMVPMFKENEFAAHLAAQTISGYEDAPMTITTPDALTFSYTTVGSSTPEEMVTSGTDISFNLRGTTQLVWTFDQEQLLSDLAGKSKTALPTVLSGYSAIERAEATIKPFWKGSFPEEAGDITLTIVIGEGEE